jgi:hypothetical protein
VVFVADVVVTFFMPFRETEKNGGMMVHNNQKIARVYLSGWFFLDVFTCIPFDMIIAGIAEAADYDVNTQLFRILRMLRLVKLVRMLRASPIISRWQDHIGFSYAFLSLIKFTFITGLMAHWLACLWGFAGTYSTTQAWTG